MEDDYKRKLLNSAEKLSSKADAFRAAKALAERVIDCDEEAAAVELLRLLVVDPKAMGEDSDVIQAVRDVHDSLLMYCGYRQIRTAFDKAASQDDDSRTLSQLMSDLDSLVGLDEVKRKVRDLIAYQQVQRLRRENGLFSEKSTLHLAFTGNPGTGKTTVARIVGRIYRQIGLLSKGHFVEVSRTDLIAGYQGQTALKVKRVIEKSRGGVLFIDEAYSITENDHSDSYGRECLTELTKALEDCRGDLVVIVAGYSKPMEKFFDSNPGLKSRFNTFIEFPDYTADELLAIFTRICSRNDYKPTDELKSGVLNYFKETTSEKVENFANGRLVRNLFDDIVMNHARRCSVIKNPTRNDLSELQICDMMLLRVNAPSENA